MWVINYFLNFFIAEVNIFLGWEEGEKEGGISLVLSINTCLFPFDLFLLIRNKCFLQNFPKWRSFSWSLCKNKTYLKIVASAFWIILSIFEDKYWRNTYFHYYWIMMHEIYIIFIISFFLIKKLLWALTLIIIKSWFYVCFYENTAQSR